VALSWKMNLSPSCWEKAFNLLSFKVNTDLRALYLKRSLFKELISVLRFIGVVILEKRVWLEVE
jgi:hypothetical protein